MYFSSFIILIPPCVFSSEIEFISTQQFVVSFRMDVCFVEIGMQRVWKKCAQKYPLIQFKSCKFHWHLFFFKCLFSQKPVLYILAFTESISGFSRVQCKCWTFEGMQCVERFGSFQFCFYSKSEIIQKLCNAFDFLFKSNITGDIFLSEWHSSLPILISPWLNLIMHFWQTQFAAIAIVWHAEYGLGLKHYDSTRTHTF